MKDSQRKAMFAKGKKRYTSFSVARAKMHVIAKKEGLKNEADWNKFVDRKPMSYFIKVGIPTNPNKVWSKANVAKNQRNGVNINKEVYY